MEVGRPSKYKPEYAEQTEGLCLLGLKDIELAQFFKVTEKTLNNWKEKHPEFLQALKKGRQEADIKVVKSLYKQAIEGNVVAMIFWLKNRHRDKWRDKPPEHKDGDAQQPAVVKVVVEHGNNPDTDRTTS